jgi:plastocyanin
MTREVLARGTSLCLALLAHAAPALGDASLAGRLTVPSRSSSPTARANPYPGRVASLAHAAPARLGAASDAVIYVETVPEKLVLPNPATTPPELVQKDQTFLPRVVAVQVGTTVEFPNRDPIYHNVFSVSPAKRFDLGKYPKGQSRRVRFDKPGLVQVFCDIHSDMAAFVLVVPHHVFARPDAEGRFRLPALSDGSYRLRSWHPDFGELVRDVALPADAARPLELRY